MPDAKGDYMNLKTILSELGTERDRIDQAILALEAIDATGRRRAGRPPKAIQKRPTFSAAARARMAAAQRARWAKAKQAETSKPARRMSRAARKKIAAAQRARWAKVKAQKKTA